MSDQAADMRGAIDRIVGESHRGRIVLWSSALPPSTEVTAFIGWEQISTPYRFQITLAMSREDSVSFDLNEAMGSRASFVFLSEARARPMIWHGVLSIVECLSEFGETATYRAELMPRMWTLRHEHHSNVFVNETIPEIIRGILEDQGFTDQDFELRLLGARPQMEHVCQYRETNFDFISRWMEREGIYYFFEQLEDRERLVITDAPLRETLRTEPILYRPVAEAMPAWAGEAFSCFLARQTTVPASVRLRDYDYLRPDVDVAGSSPITSHGIGEVVLYGENFTSEDEGMRLARLYAERARAHERVYYSLGSVTHVRPGYTYLLDDHPRGELNGEYLTTRCEYSGNARDSATGGDDLVIKVKVTSIPAGVPYRPERTTPTPRIHGFEIAVVDGEADSPYAQIDAHGRYAVKIHFDESDLRHGKASTWVRMLQPHGGGKEGFHFPLRKKTEVLLAFLGGDPDRPVIVGVAPNANTPSPVINSNHTKNVLQTGGENRMEMEDSAGAQYMTLSSPSETTFLHMGAIGGAHERNFVLSTQGNGRMHTGGDMEVFAYGDQEVRVRGHRKKRIERDETHVVEGERTVTVKRDDKLTVEQARAVEIKGSLTHLLRSDRTVEIGTSDRAAVDQLLVRGTRSVDVTFKTTERLHGGREVSIEKGDVELVKGSDKKTRVDGTYEIAADTHFELSSGGAVLHVDDEVMSGESSGVIVWKTRSEDEVRLYQGDVTIVAGKKLVLKCGPSTIEMSSEGIALKGPIIKLNC